MSSFQNLSFNLAGLIYQCVAWMKQCATKFLFKILIKKELPSLVKDEGEAAKDEEIDEVDNGVMGCAGEYKGDGVFRFKEFGDVVGVFVGARDGFFQKRFRNQVDKSDTNVLEQRAWSAFVGDDETLSVLGWAKNGRR